MAKGKERMLGSLRVRSGDDLQSVVTIRKQNDRGIDVSETRVRWTIDTDLTKLVEVRRSGKSNN